VRGVPSEGAATEVKWSLAKGGNVKKKRDLGGRWKDNLSEKGSNKKGQLGRGGWEESKGITSLDMAKSPSRKPLLEETLGKKAHCPVTRRLKTRR